jgi:hypothetical protein
MSARHESDLARVLAEETGAPTRDNAPRVVAAVLGTLARMGYCGLTGWPNEVSKSRAAINADIQNAFDLLEAGLSRYGTTVKSRASGRLRRRNATA